VPYSFGFSFEPAAARSAIASTTRSRGTVLWSYHQTAKVRIVAAVDEGARGLAHHPRSLRWVERFPALGRRYSRRMARGADLDDRAVRVGGTVVG
jgi:hypothetical protein